MLMLMSKFYAELIGLKEFLINAYLKIFSLLFLCVEPVSAGVIIVTHDTLLVG